MLALESAPLRSSCPDVNKDTVQLQDRGTVRNWFADQLCTPSHLRARVSLWLRRQQQLHTARSQFNPQRHQRSNTLKQVQCTMCIGKRSANRGADSEKQIWHLGHSQLRASTLTPRPLCTGYAVPSLFTRKVIFILSRCEPLPQTV